MKIVIVGATGTIGKAVVAALYPRHEILAVGNRGGAFQVDIADAQSIRALFQKTGRFDALVAAVGKVHFGEFAKMTEKEFDIGIRNKLMGQVNLVLKGRAYVNDGGSFTLTSGSLDRYPVRGGSNAATINAALGGFVRAAALDLDRGIRINLVSPALLEESTAKFAPLLPGHEAVSSARVGLAYVKSVEGGQTGQVYEIG